nr:mucin-17-like isoform X6 [Misgurnus anguillicaudatus]
MTVTPETSTSHPTSPKGMNPNRPVTPQHKKSTTTRPKASTVITMNSNTVQKSSVPTSTVTPKTTLKSPETTNAHSAITTAPSIMTPTHMSTSSATTPLTIAPSSIQSAKITPKDSTTVTVTPETSTNHPTSHKPNPSATPTSPKSTRPEASTIITMNSNTMQKLSVHTSPLTTTLKSSETTNAHSEILTSSGITSAYPTTTPLQEPVIFPQTSNGTSHQNDQTKTSTKSPTTMHPSISTTKTATATTSVTPALHSPTKTTRQTFSASPTKKPIGTTISTAIKTSPLPTYTTTAMPKKTTFLNKTPVLTSNLPPVTVPKSTPKVTGSEMVTSLGTTHAYPKTTPLQEPVIIPQTSNGTSHQNDQTKTSTKSPTTMHPSISTTKTATATTSATPVLHLPTQTPHQTSSASPTTKPIAKTTSAAIKTMHSSISTTKTATAKTSVTPVLSSATQTAHQTSSASSTTKNTLTAVTSPTPFTTYTSTTMHKTTSFSKTSPVLTSTLGTKPKSTPKGTVFTSSGATYTYLTTKTLQEPVIIPQTSNETSHPNIPTCKCGIAVVTSTLRFNSSSPVPSQDLVLNAISDLQNSRESQLIESVKVLNITYEKISETSYEVKLTFAVSNITIPVDKEQTNSTLKNLQDVVNVAVNTLLNEPGKAPLQPNSSSFQSTPNQINGVLNYIIQDGNAVQPVSFLQKLQSLMGSSTTSASPLTTSSSPVTSGSAVVTSTLQFNSSSPVPSQDLVLKAISDLRNSRESQLNESVKLLNVTYKKISETSYEIKLTFAVSNVSMPVDIKQRNSTFTHLQDVVKLAVNTLLNEPGKAPLQPNSSSFQSTPNQINGSLNYIIRDGDAIQPVSFLQKLQSLKGSSTTSASPLTSSSPVTSVKFVSSSAVVTSTLQFNSPSSVPSKDLVLKAISDLRNSRESQLNESVKLLNVTYEKISETSYEVKLTFAVSNVSMPVDIKQRNSTLTHLQDVVNVAVNTLLNEPGKAPLQPNSSSFLSTPNQINGSLNYIIGDGDAIQPVSFLQKLQSLKGSSTTSASPLATSSSPVTSVKFVSGSAVVTSTLQFNSLSPVPSQDLVLKAISDLRNSRESQLNESVKLLNVTYEKISETSYEIKLTFAVSNVSMPVDITQRNSTLTHLQDVVNVAVNTLLNEPGKAPLQPNSSSFQSTPNQINGSLNYIIRDGDAIQPVSFLQKLQSLKGSSTTSASPLTSSSPVTSVKFVSGSAVVTSTLQFNSPSSVPSKDLVLKAISDLRNSRESQLNESVKLLNVTYEKISENSYEVKLTFAVSNVSMPVDIKQRNSTLKHLEDVVNVAVNTLLNEPGKVSLQPNSSSFQETPNQINGSLNYIIRDGDAIQPVSFLQKLQSLKESSTTSASPLTTSSSPVRSGSAVVTSTLQFNSSSPVPSQDLVLKAISDLRNSRESQLNESVKLLNVTYEKISENSYKVQLTFAVSNVSMPVDIKQRNSTFTHLQDVANVAVNTLLNEPGKATLQPNSSSFQSTPNQINGSLNYIIRDGDAIQPVSFLQKLQSLKGSSTTSASPLATSSSPVTSGSAVVTSTLQFNSSSPVPSQDLVLKAISDLRNSRESQLNESVKLLNVTYEKISENSYEVKLTFAVSNVSMPVDIKQRNSTFTHLQDVVNVAVNTLLNEPGKASLQPNSSSFLSTPNHINGSLNYIIRNGDAIQPVSFLQKLQSLKGSSTTSASPLATSSSPVTSGSAVVTSTLQFNSSSPVPSKDLVLKAISDLRNSRESQLNESVKLLNVTYEKISETSYEVKLTFAVSNVSMPVDIKQRNSTFTHLQDVANVAVNTLLNEPGKASLQPNSSSFQSTPNHINGSLNYIIHDGDAIQPISFLQKLQSLKGSSTTSASPLATSSSPVTSGSAVVTSTLQFNSSSPVPSKDLVLKAISDLRNSRESQLNESVKLLNVTYEKISETSYEVKFTFAVSNVSMPVDIKQRNSTIIHLQDVVNVAVNTLLNEPGKAPLQPNSSSFQSTQNQINGSLNYIIRDGDAIQPVSFLQKLQSLKGSSTTSASPLATSSSPVTSGSAVVTSTLQFNSSSPVPSQDLVLKAISDLRNSRESQLNESVKLLNVTYEKISENSYEVKLTFAVSNVSMPVDIKQRNSTFTHLQDVVNVAVNTLLNEPGKASLQPNSSSFQSTPNHINGSLNYIIRDGDAIQPVSFLQKLQSLKGSSTTSASPLATSSSPVTSGSAVVTSTLQFNSSSPVPSQDLVLKAISDLRNSRESQLNESVKLLNVTYEKISETSYEVKFTFAVSNVSMPVDIKQRNSTIIHLQDVVNVAVNTLLNEPGKASLQPNSSSFESTPNHINGSLNYIIRDGDAIQPVSFLQKLQSLKGSSTTSASPLTTSSSPVTSGSAVVTSTLQFNSSSPVPSKDLVLKAISDLRNSRESQLNESVKLLNVTYEKISENSYEIKLTFAVSNVSMPVDIKQKNSTFTHLQDVVNVAVNTLLNEPGKASLQPNSSSFLSTPNHINGSLNYIIRDGDAIQPVSFLQKLQSLKGSSTTSASPLTTSSSPVKSGSAVVTSTLQFNSSSPVPSQDLVLKAISDLRNSRESQLNESVKLLNVTYEKISENSYKVQLTFAVSNVSMPVDIKQRNSTFTHLQDVVNVAVNTLLNEPGKVSLQPNSSSFQSTPNQINGLLNYIIQDGDAIQPVSFLQKFQSLKGSSTTSASPLTSSSPVNFVLGSAVVTSTLQFNSLSPVPSQDLVYKAISDLRSSRESKLNEPVKLVNVSYTKTSETSYAVLLTFVLSNISMPEKPELRNNTFQLVQDITNNALNTLLNEPGNANLKPNSSNFSSTQNQIVGNMEYDFQTEDTIKPISFLNNLQLPPGLTTTNTPMTNTTSLGDVIIYIRLVFITVKSAPNESTVLQLAYSLLAARLRTKRDVQQLNDPVSFVDVTYQRISDKVFALNFGYIINNVTITQNPVLKNQTLGLVQKSINKLLNEILSSPTATPYQFKQANFTGNSTVIRADVEYVFSDNEITAPSPFIKELILKVNGSITSAPATTTFYPTVVATTGRNNSTSAAWVVAIIVPCAIAIMLIPCWILLCCLLCGCCAGVRRRWDRRRSYNIRYYIHNL